MGQDTRFRALITGNRLADRNPILAKKSSFLVRLAVESIVGLQGTNRNDARPERGQHRGPSEGVACELIFALESLHWRARGAILGFRGSSPWVQRGGHLLRVGTNSLG